MKRVFIILLLLLLGCKKQQTEEEYLKHLKEDCNYYAKIANNEIEKGNVYLFTGNKLGDIKTEYFIFKKYGNVEYLHYYPESIHECFMKVMEEKIGQKNKAQIFSSIDSLTLIENKKFEKWLSLKTDSPYLSYNTDGAVFSTIDIEDPKVIYPINNDNFKKDLVKTILKKDMTFFETSFWITINNDGSFDKIEVYRKHSELITNYVTEKLRNAKWKPGCIKQNKKKIKTIFFYRITKPKDTKSK